MREVTDRGSGWRKSYCIMHCSVANPSPSHSSSPLEVPQCPGLCGGSGKGHSGSWNCECHRASRMSLLASERAALLVHRSLCETEFYSELHYMKRAFVPQSSQSYLHCPWNPGKLAVVFRPKWQQIMLMLSLGYLYWFQHKIVLGLGIAKMLIFLLEVRFKPRSTTRKQH